MGSIFVDLDNTLAANETCENVDFYKGLYYDKQPIQIVIDAINEIYSNDEIFIMSRYVGEKDGYEEKIKWIREYLPDSMQKNSPYLISANDEKTKAQYILNHALMNELPIEDCTIIDDNKQILQECKKVKIKTLYPQQVICKYEARK